MPQRPATDDDSSALLDLFHRAEQVELGAAYTIAADIDRLLRTPGLDLTTRSMVVIDDGGRLDGFAALHPAPNQSALRAQLVVGPERPTETADVLLTLLAEWADADHTNGIHEVNLYQLPNALAGPALRKHGWRIGHSNTRLVIDLAAPPVPVTPNPRVRVRVAAGEEQRRLAHTILEDAVAQDWNHQRKDFAEFMAEQQARPGYDPELWFIADLDDEPAGVLIARDPDGRPWVAWLGVAELRPRQRAGQEPVAERVRRVPVAWAEHGRGGHGHAQRDRRGEGLREGRHGVAGHGRCLVPRP